MVKKAILLVVTVLLVLVAANCARGATSTTLPAAGPSSKPGSAAAAEPEWKGVWAKTLATAREEGKVTIYTTYPGELRVAVSKALAAQYGIEAEFVTGRGPELREKLFAERRSGLYLADLWMMGISSTMSDLKPAGVLAPMPKVMVLPEVADPKLWWQGQLPFGDRENQYVFTFSLSLQKTIVYNSELVKADEVTSYRDLLNPKWKGRLLLSDPTITGAGLEVFRVVGFKLIGLDYMRALAAQEPFITRDQRLSTEWVARGKNPILIGPMPELVTEFRKTGAPLAWVTPSEGEWLSPSSSGMSLVDRGPHPNATSVFVNWFLGKQGQELYSTIGGVESARVDVPTSQLDPTLMRDPRQKYYIQDEEFYLQSPEHLKAAQDIFGRLVK